MQLVEDYIFEGFDEARAHMNFALPTEVPIRGYDQSQLFRGQTVDTTQGKVFKKSLEFGVFESFEKHQSCVDLRELLIRD